MAQGGEPDEVLSKPIQAEEHRHLRWLILDGKTFAWSHGRDQGYSYKGITLAVDSLRDMGHRNPLILCVPEWMTQHEEAHNLNQLQDKVLLFITPACSDFIEASEISFMDALAKKIDALIVTQTGPDTWIESCNRRDPRGKRGPTLQEMLQSDRVPNEQKVKYEISSLTETWKKYCGILKGPLESFSVKQRQDPIFIIDGSNVAMTHGLHRFYSGRGIYQVVMHFLREGYRVNAYVPIWRKYSKNTVYGILFLSSVDIFRSVYMYFYIFIVKMKFYFTEHKLLQLLYQHGFVTYTPSMAYDDRFILEEAKNKRGYIVSNDKFRDAPQEYINTIQRCIRFRFQGNHFKVLPNPCQAVDHIDAQVVYEKTAWSIHTHSTKVDDNEDTDATIVYDKTTWSMATPSTEIHQDPQILASSKVYSHGKAIVQDERLTLAKAKPKQELQPALSGDLRAEHQTSSQDCGGLKKPTSTGPGGLATAEPTMLETADQQAHINTLKSGQRGTDNIRNNKTTSSPQQAHGSINSGTNNVGNSEQQAHFNTCTWSGNIATNSGTKHFENSIPTSSPQQAQEVHQQQNQRQKGRTNKLNSTCSRPPSAVETTMKTVDQQTHLNMPKSRINSGTNNDGNSGLTSSPQGVRQQKNQQWWNRRSRKQRTNKVTSTGSGGLPTAETTSETADQQAYLNALMETNNIRNQQHQKWWTEKLIVLALISIFLFFFYIYKLVQSPYKLAPYS
ncbi:uncharacterized protein LOC125308455 isoform X2 [Alosa alosa]|uniref:uncharacterized protein LOC125308455 isoform X2 n=1 Tax=Alosa alosa TaxID=278164 RepID=UPI002015459D|nr:uncharacterized protein LOC125308455 isoform X2 [Alosa alosa]